MRNIVDFQHSSRGKDTGVLSPSHCGKQIPAFACWFKIDMKHIDNKRGQT